MRLIALLMLASPVLIGAEDPHLGAIRALLAPMRKSHDPDFKTRGATPALTAVKHELIAWVESRLPELHWNGSRWEPDPVVLQEQLNDELDRAGLFCGSSQSVPCPDWSELGFLGRIAFDMKPGILVARTAVEIDMCGEDQSAYAYESSDDHWRKFWQSEQNDYRADLYFPQRFDEIAISPADWSPGADKTEHLILTLGHNPWCSSNWHPVYYRVWQTKSSYANPLLLLDGKKIAFISEPIRGAVDATQVLFEFDVESTPGYTSREIRHYLLREGRLERVDPVALSPRWFLAFWLGNQWSEVVPWSAESGLSQLKEWSQQHNGPFSEPSSPTLHCKQHADQWQVSTYYGEHEEQQVYFLIRWRPPFRFTMLAAGEKPWPDCTEEDPEADQPNDLFFGR